ncbi:nascent polypeptide-associated complex protein [Methanonatronarchaeum sp. AMET6-2]|uniref:nascent polypeptide-associated complex protein n=1 Tax=Methanonatronarchaeum sp. AMET6-2 TaxID=2933293 RepID=UPI001215710A|nr:nascent polypeptide-associated complex protein [Methanonatronarchaeum sp. AMET6-2]RZN61746.1 MAG: nascent polypeptide-associated complex protein [Methanonatronarchaeia archaeon]UOY10096.1 nascent polypeptide-associated complex protein [Methanonatronarchaeum sp. AMET6-2]
MFPGMRGGFDQRKMDQLMKQMGIDIEEIDDVEEVVIKTADKDLVFSNANVTVMDAKGQKTYQVIGNPEEIKKEVEPDEEDVEFVMEQTDCTEQEAIDALKDNEGDIAEAIIDLE